MSGIRSEGGVALVVAMMALLLMTAIGSVVILTSSSETLIAAHFRDAVEARNAANAILERGMDNLAGENDWTVVIGGTVRSAWIDGAPWGVRALPDGSTIDLGHVINTANCQKTTVCSAADMSLVTPDRPWGANNPRWVLYAYGPVSGLLPSHSIDSPYYVVLLAGAAVAPEGWSAIALRAEAFGPSGAHAVVGAAVGRAPGQIAPKVLFWREVR